MAFDQATRNRLQKFVSDARKLLSEEFTQQLQNTYGLDPITGGIAELGDLPSLSPSEQQTAKLLRDTLEHYLAAHHKADPYADKALVTAALDRIVREQAFTVLNRLAALRMAEARQFVMESISQGYQSKGFQLYQRIAGSSLGETGQAYQHYLFSVFDELSLDLAVLFDRYSSQGRLFPRETVLLELLELINHTELELLWGEDETIGWIYQYFNSREERKKMRDESQAPRNSRELAVRNQFFTPRYVVEFLTDNTLGRIWYEMTQGNTALVDSCHYLVRRPNEVFLRSGEQTPEQNEIETAGLSQEDLLRQTVYIQCRPMKDPRDIKMLDPACGSMHFGLYAFDLFEKIYSEAWDIEAKAGKAIFFREDEAVTRDALNEAYSTKDDFLADVPRLIIEHNIHGIDIDPRAVQIAGLSLWMRAQKSWSDNAIKPNQRPQIQRSNIVCAEPMPGEKFLLKEFTSQIQPRVLGQLVEEIFDKMQLAGEAGSLLKIEEEIQGAIEEARSQKDENILEVQGGLFAENKWEVREGKRYYNFGDAGDEFWGQAEQLILEELERYAELATGSKSGQKRLFVADTAKGLAFIDICRRDFDAVVMNPPFGLGPVRCNDYLKQKYTDTYIDYYASFVSRGKALASDGYVGAITSRSFLTTKKLTRWRENEVLDSAFLLLDLGLGVMDDAFVESCAYVLSSARQDANFLAFDNQGNEVDLSKEGVWKSSWYVTQRQILRELPDSKILYSLPQRFLALLNSNEVFEPEIGTAREGMRSFDDVRFLRLRWEVDSKNIGNNQTWEPLAKGGEFSRYYSDIHLLVKWNRVAEELAEFNKLVNGQVAQSRQASSYYRRPGCTYSKRSAKGFSVRALPAGCIIGTKGPAILSESNVSPGYLLGWVNSRLIRNLVQFQANASEFNTGIVKKLPWIYAGNESLEKETEEVIRQMISWANFDETSSYFNVLKLASRNLEASFNDYLQRYNDLIGSLESLQSDWDSWVDDVYDVNSTEIKISEDDGASELLATDYVSVVAYNEYVFRFVSYVFGVLVQRWDKERHKVSTSNDFNVYDELPNPVPGALVDELNDSAVIVEIDSYSSIEARFQDVVGSLDLDSESIVGEIISSLNTSLESYFSKPAGFFASHLKQYSKSRRQAPVYWPLQSSSGKYTLWVYYGHVSESTLYTCVNDFIGPKLKHISEDISGLRNKTDRSSDEEVRLSELVDLEGEVRDFHDEILRIAQIWKPNLNDGVQINAAPLWRLFQHSPWRNKLKKTWEEMEQGDYDWSCLALRIWPQRVIRKAYEDRSLAVAHNVEHDLWEKIEVGAARGKGTKFVWQPKEFNDLELENYIQKMVAQG